MTATPQPPRLTFFARLDVAVAAPIDLGVVDGEHRRIVPILGGTFRSADATGEVLPAGADFQVIRDDGRHVLEARYAVRLDDGTHLTVHNRALRAGAPEDLAALARGERVPPERIYFRGHPAIAAPAGRWDWLNSRLLVARGERTPDAVGLDVFVVD